MSGRKHYKNILLYLVIVYVILSCYTVQVKDNYGSHITEPQINTAEPEAAAVMHYYEGKLLNIFFHPVIARPEIAFNSSMRDHFLDWFVTADEFKKIIYELYIQDFVLVNIDEFYEVTYENNIKRITAKKLLVPEGKKPMVLSVDDLSYYKYMKRYGTVHKLVIDEKNEIAAWTDNGNGGELSYDLDVITILENFIKRHPDFSVRGARGIIALTGFEGVLGYSSQQRENSGYQEEADKAAVIVNKLKELGWRFASHSYAHWDLQNITFENFMSDMNRWDIEVRPIIGDTDLYIYPFGAGVEAHAEKHRALRNRGFNLFFGVGLGYDYRVTPGYIYFERKSIDGIYFRVYRNRQDRLFDIDKVIDRELRNGNR